MTSFLLQLLCKLSASAVLCGWKFHRNAMERFTDFLARLITSLFDILPLLTRLSDINYKIKISACTRELRDHIIWVWEIRTVALLYMGYPQTKVPGLWFYIKEVLRECCRCRSRQNWLILLSLVELENAKEADNLFLNNKNCGSSSILLSTEYP